MNKHITLKDFFYTYIITRPLRQARKTKPLTLIVKIFYLGIIFIIPLIDIARQNILNTVFKDVDYSIYRIISVLIAFIGGYVYCFIFNIIIMKHNKK
jgi:hypothetical protein